VSGWNISLEIELSAIGRIFASLHSGETMIALIALFACTDGNGPKDSSEPIPTDQVDADNDGYFSLTSGGTDCDDENAAINPAAQELCDETETDENCDGETDSGELYYSDNDRDGYGTGSGSTSCNAPPDTSAQGGDCNDQDPAINPAATEVCDDQNVDEDCDGVADDADSSVDPASFKNFFPDVDQDGYGSENDIIKACDASSTALSSPEDCDDGDATVNPAATESLCDGVDQDGNGTDACDAWFYESNLQNITIIQPAGVGSILGSYLPAQVFLAVVEQGTTLEFSTMQGDGNGNPLCDSGQFTADWSNAPAFSSPETDMSFAGFPIEDMTLDGRFAADMSSFSDGHARWEQDLRGLAASFGFTEDELCDLVVSFGISCHACDDGQEYCLTMEAEDIQGTQVFLSTTAVGTDCTPSNCSVVDEKAGLLLTGLGLLMAGLRRKSH
jgi:hypothetical protein